MQKTSAPTKMLDSFSSSGQITRVNARSKLDPMPEIPLPSMTAPMYLNGIPAATANTDAWHTPETSPKPKSREKHPQNPAPLPRSATKGTRTKVNDISEKVITKRFV